MIAPIYILAEPIIYFKNIYNFVYIFFIMPRSYLPCGRSLSLHQIVHWLSDMYHSLYSTLLPLFRHIYPRTPGLPEDLFPLRCSAALHLLPCFIIHIVKYLHAVNPPWQITAVLKFCFWWFSALLHPFHYLCQFSRLLLSRIIIYFFFYFSLFSLDLIAKYPIEICP